MPYSSIHSFRFISFSFGEKFRSVSLYSSQFNSCYCPVGSFHFNSFDFTSLLGCICSFGLSLPCVSKLRLFLLILWVFELFAGGPFGCTLVGPCLVQRRLVAIPHKVILRIWCTTKDAVKMPFHLSFQLKTYMSLIYDNYWTWSSWWFQPLWKILVKLDYSPSRGENKKYLKPPANDAPRVQILTLLLQPRWHFAGWLGDA